MALRLGVSVSSYYDYCNCKYIKRAAKKILLSEKIRTCFNECRQVYGSRRLAVELTAAKVPVSHTTVSKYMNQMGLRSTFYPKYRNTTDSQHNNHIADNLLDRNFSVASANKAWVSDITYVSVIGGFEYLTTVIDLYDRKVIGYSLSRTMKACDTVIPALKMAIKARQSEILDFGLIFHSDRGVQYTCGDFIQLLDKYKIIRSNSRKGDCWDNAVAESFFKTLKCELIYQFKKLLPAENMRTEIFKYIETWYNKRRRHSALGNLNILEFYNKIIKQNLLIAS